MEETASNSKQFAGDDGAGSAQSRSDPLTKIAIYRRQARDARDGREDLEGAPREVHEEGDEERLGLASGVSTDRKGAALEA